MAEAPINRVDVRLGSWFIIPPAGASNAVQELVKVNARCRQQEDASRAKHPPALANNCNFVWNMFDHAVAENTVEAGRFEGQRLGIVGNHASVSPF
jgi:hypothetical protein